MIYGSLMVLAVGLLTSPTILALSHILMIVPMIYFLPKADYKNYPKSAWALLALAIVLILSVVLNQDIALKGYAPLSKIKYFLFGFLMIAPYQWYFKKHMTEKKISWLLYGFCGATTLATVVGIYSKIRGYNPITMRNVDVVRNAGFFGMVMNYAHNLAFFLIIVTGLVIYRKQIAKYINLNFLYIVLGINLIGLYLTYTRGAWLAYLVAVPFFLLKNNKKYFVSVLIVLLIIGGVFFKFAGDAVIRPESERQRISQWQAGIKAFKERPILGYGYLNFELHSYDIKKRYDLPEKHFGGHAHSNLIEMLACAGVLGFVAFLCWVGFWVKEVKGRRDIFGLVGLPFIVVFFVGGLTQSTVLLGINLFFVMGAYCLSQRPLK